ncbi:MAG: type I pullulanase, partial [Butyricicoccus sp.]|nr:type I pullulanase [Butyricicoccus sp.]
TATAVKINLYQSGTAGTDDLIEQLTMIPDIKGTWIAEKKGDQNGVYYTYLVTVDGRTVEVCDPYARTTGVNGKRAMIIDLASTDPKGWDKDTDPHAGQNFTDAVIYELHVRDLSSDPCSGIKNAGKFLGVIETGTKNRKGYSTGLDHIKDLGITHLQLLPIFDYGSVDEAALDKPQFNWGYDPVNYNVPEGSYSTDPANGAVRVKELKQMIKGLHDNGISVIMDVVYNHVYITEQFCFNQIVPGFFSRIADGDVRSNASGCGNDTASERAMVRKYIVDSVKYWADEYHIDGFRFDLVGLLDTDTINEVITTVRKDHPSATFHGEGWNMSSQVTKPDTAMCNQGNAHLVPDFAFFNDTMRDLLRGSVFDSHAAGFISGASDKEYLLEECFLGMPGWCPAPSQSINYASCHDNATLYDRITETAAGASTTDCIRMNKLAAAIILTSQGVPFLQAGEEMLRSKPLGNGSFEHNSYNSPDRINSLKWIDLGRTTHQDVFEYYKGLIAFRKAHPALRLMTAEEAHANITFVSGMAHNVVAFVNVADPKETMYVVFNGNRTEETITLPRGQWDVYVNDRTAGNAPIETVTGQITIPAISAMVLIRK